MHVSLDDVLSLVGRLDDAPGFDTPRERFRRFLVERVTEIATLRSLLEQGQHAPGDQHTRALQDVLVMLGRVLGFETAFGSYERLAGVLKFDGLWRSRHGVEIALDSRLGDLPRSPSDLDGLIRTLAALPPLRPDTQVRRVGLCIVTTAHGPRRRLDEALAADRRYSDVRVVSMRSLLWFGEAASAGRLGHEEIAQMFANAENVDVVVDLMARTSAGGRAAIADPPGVRAPGLRSAS